MRTRSLLARAAGAAGVGVALAMAGGCRTSPAVKPAPAVTVYRADGGTDITHDIVFGSTRLARELRVTDIRRRATEHGLLYPSVTVQSLYAGTLNFEYRFCWFDGAGYEVGADTSSWKPVTLARNESKTVESVAPTAEVKSFQLRFRRR